MSRAHEQQGNRLVGDESMNGEWKVMRDAANTHCRCRRQSQILSIGSNRLQVGIGVDRVVSAVAVAAMRADD